VRLSPCQLPLEDKGRHPNEEAGKVKSNVAPQKTVKWGERGCISAPRASGGCEPPVVLWRAGGVNPPVVLPGV